MNRAAKGPTHGGRERLEEPYRPAVEKQPPRFLSKVSPAHLTQLCSLTSGSGPCLQRQEKGGAAAFVLHFTGYWWILLVDLLVDLDPASG